jgi:hypothetical protein
MLHLDPLAISITLAVAIVTVIAGAALLPSLIFFVVG